MAHFVHESGRWADPPAAVSRVYCCQRCCQGGSAASRDALHDLAESRQAPGQPIGENVPLTVLADVLDPGRIVEEDGGQRRPLALQSVAHSGGPALCVLLELAKRRVGRAWMSADALGDRVPLREVAGQRELEDRRKVLGRLGPREPIADSGDGQEARSGQADDGDDPSDKDELLLAGQQGAEHGRPEEAAHRA
jgi:hypothetical protein